jgi:hypothetical protein
MDDTDIAFLLSLGQEIEEEEIEDELARVGAFAACAIVGAEESRQLRVSRRRRAYLTRPNLLRDPRKRTPWQRLYEKQDDRAFITTMGFDVKSFNHILYNGFEKHWNSVSIPRSDISSTAAPRAYRRSLDAAGALGLALHYLTSTMREVSLQQIFALIPSTVSRYITFSLKILAITLRSTEESQIKWPSGDEFQENNALITARHPLLDGAFGSMDGLNLAIQESNDQEVENATYNSWLHSHFVSCVFAFSAEG